MILLVRYARCSTADFGTNRILDSVVISIPYFSTVEGMEKIQLYSLDSIYGTGKVDVKEFMKISTF
jgi:hypothetical protein